MHLAEGTLARANGERCVATGYKVCSDTRGIDLEYIIVASSARAHVLKIMEYVSCEFD